MTNRSVIHRAAQYLLLPAEITKFERAHLERVNRIALWFFVLHVPVFTAVAYFNDTDPLQALVLTSMVIAGPVVARSTLANPRAHAVVFGVTAMLMGGLLVHFGRGPVQIEMHFYFFVLLALLAVFGNPMAIVAAAVTVAAHHAILFFVLPASVFNYDAPFWVVAVHAGFVVLESVAACFVARSFFDNVIGLETIVQARTQQLDVRNTAMARLLNNVGEGFLTIDARGVMSAERSAILETWLGPAGDATFPEYIGRRDPELAQWFELGLESIVDDVLPLDLAIDQLPKRVVVDGRHLALEYKPILRADSSLEELLVCVADITTQVEAERAEQAQREMFTLFQQMVEDKASVTEFNAEADALVSKIEAAEVEDRVDVARWLHTLKGNAAIFGLGSIATYCHTMEDGMEETHAIPSRDQRVELSRRWSAMSTRIRSLLGESRSRVEIDDADYRAFERALSERRSHKELASMMATWTYEPTKHRLIRIAEQAKGIAERLGKGDLRVTVEPNDVRLPFGALSPFWAAIVHVVRNAVDHGLEEAEERRSQGKDPSGTLRLSTRVVDGSLVVEIADDGRGIDWNEIGTAATKKGLPAANSSDLLSALVASGVTTKRTATEYSGRGVGVPAVVGACRELGGDVEIQTEDGLGTTFRFRLPVVPTARAA